MGKKKGTKKSTAKGKNKKSKKVKVKKVKVETTIIEPLQPPPPPPPSQGEFICIHIGQAGVQVGSACWELFCLEHGINPDGTVHQLATNSTSMFSLSEDGCYTPRALLIDTEPSVIDLIKNGSYQKLFSPQSMICGKEDAASNFATGFHGIGKMLSSTVMDQLACLAENCNSLQGIAVFRSISGGTGSGMGSKIINNIKNSYPNKTIIDFNFCSSPDVEPVVVGPYNAALAINHALDVVNCSFLFDNKSLNDICSIKLGFSNPTYGNINSIIALVASGITSSLRFEGSIMYNISELLTNLIPQPRLHFPLITYAPLTNNTHCNKLASTQLVSMSFDPHCQMTRIDSRLGKYLSVCMMFRGDLNPTDINTTIAFIQREQTLPVLQNINSPLFKFGLCNRFPVTIPNSGISPTTRSITTLCNSTSVKGYWINMMNNYNKLFKRRVYLHHYFREGMEEETFNLTNENISKLITEYEELENS